MRAVKACSAWSQWNANCGVKEFPQEEAEFLRRISGELPPNWRQHADGFSAKSTTKPKVRRRKASQNAIGIEEALPELVGGSADLTGSAPDPGFSKASADCGRQLHYVRRARPGMSAS